jgi:phosphoribosyl-dephospho-CoA transferase
VRPHDLLRLAGPIGPAGAPGWVAEALAATPWVVVRRSRAGPGLIPVGVRGPNRADRFGFDLHPAAVAELVRPEDLAQHGAGSAPDRRPAWVALDRARAVLAATTWGPTGSVGFELATGRPTVTPDSDLDLIVRADTLPGRAELRRLHRELPDHADCLIETPGGAVALAELATGAPQVLLRTARGPRLVSV